MKIQIFVLKSPKKLICTLEGLSGSTSINDLKNRFYEKNAKYYPSRQQFKSDLSGKALQDHVKLEELKLTDGGALYFKDLGPQIGYTTVFILEYLGPLLIYPIFLLFPQFIYGVGYQDHHWVVKSAAACWIFHYSKRILETIFIHRFSHGTMPLGNLYRNCGYYWSFAAFISYFVNHPLFHPPSFGDIQAFIAIGVFVLSQIGNFSIHVALSNLRPVGTTERKIPRPTSNPFTWLFGLVTCPNYTYEVFIWLAFTIMTQCLPALLFTLAGFYQMAVWAIGKHRRNKKEFSDYPRGRKAILPFIL